MTASAVNVQANGASGNIAFLNGGGAYASVSYSAPANRLDITSDYTRITTNPDTNISVNGNNIGIATDAGSIALSALSGLSLSATAGDVNINGTGNIYMNTKIKPTAIMDNVSSIGTAGQFLSSTGSGISWVNGGASSTGFTATGGDSTTTFTQNGIQYKAHIFSTTGASSFTITSFGTSTNPTIDVLLVGAGASGGRGDGSVIQGGGGGSGSVVQIYDLPLLNSATLPQTITTLVGPGGASKTTAGTGNPGQSSYLIIPDVLNISNTNITVDTGSSGAGGGGTSAPSGGGNSTYFIPIGNNVQFVTQQRMTGGAGGCAGGIGANITRGNASYNYSGVNGGALGETITGGAWGAGAGSTASNQAGSGGGGARGTGAASSSQARTAGGGGLVTYFDGTRRQVGGGGQGAGLQSGVGNLLGNIYGGGLGQAGATPPTAGAANTGGGGGGSFNLDSGAGGSGLIIIRYKS